jgi:uncharacterized protein YaiL (DUF2058 family)
LDLRAKQNNATAKQLDMLFEKMVAGRRTSKRSAEAAYLVYRSKHIKKLHVTSLRRAHY